MSHPVYAVATGSARAMPSGISVPGRATQGGLVWHQSRRCLFRQPAASGLSLSIRLWKICGKQSVFPGRTLGPFPQSSPKVSSSISNINTLYLPGGGRFNPIRVKADTTPQKTNKQAKKHPSYAEWLIDWYVTLSVIILKGKEAVWKVYKKCQMSECPFPTH